MNLTARKMRRFYKTFRKYKKDSQTRNNARMKEGTKVVSYACKESGRIRTYCPKLKKKRKDRAMMEGTLSDSDIHSSEDEDEKENKEAEEEAMKALVCLMADDEIKSNKGNKKNSLT